MAHGSVRGFRERGFLLSRGVRREGAFTSFECEGEEGVERCWLGSEGWCSEDDQEGYRAK